MFVPAVSLPVVISPVTTSEAFTPDVLRVLRVAIGLLLNVDLTNVQLAYLYIDDTGVLVSYNDTTATGGSPYGGPLSASPVAQRVLRGIGGVFGGVSSGFEANNVSATSVSLGAASNVGDFAHYARGLALQLDAADVPSLAAAALTDACPSVVLGMAVVGSDTAAAQRIADALIAPGGAAAVLAAAARANATGAIADALRIVSAAIKAAEEGPQTPLCSVFRVNVRVTNVNVTSLPYTYTAWEVDPLGKGPATTSPHTMTAVIIVLSVVGTCALCCIVCLWSRTRRRRQRARNRVHDEAAAAARAVPHKPAHRMRARTWLRSFQRLVTLDPRARRKVVPMCEAPLENSGGSGIAGGAGVAGGVGVAGGGKLLTPDTLVSVISADGGGGSADNLDGALHPRPSGDAAELPNKEVDACAAVDSKVSSAAEDAVVTPAAAPSESADSSCDVVDSSLADEDAVAAGRDDASTNSRVAWVHMEAVADDRSVATAGDAELAAAAASSAARDAGAESALPDSSTPAADATANASDEPAESDASIKLDPCADELVGASSVATLLFAASDAPPPPPLSAPPARAQVSWRDVADDLLNAQPATRDGVEEAGATAVAVSHGADDETAVHDRVASSVLSSAAAAMAALSDAGASGWADAVSTNAVGGGGFDAFDVPPPPTSLSLPARAQQTWRNVAETSFAVAPAADSGAQSAVTLSAQSAAPPFRAIAVDLSTAVAAVALPDSVSVTTSPLAVVADATEQSGGGTATSQLALPPTPAEGSDALLLVPHLIPPPPPAPAAARPVRAQQTWLDLSTVGSQVQHVVGLSQRRNAAAVETAEELLNSSAIAEAVDLERLPGSVLADLEAGASGRGDACVVDETAASHSLCIPAAESQDALSDATERSFATEVPPADAHASILVADEPLGGEERGEGGNAAALSTAATSCGAPLEGVGDGRILAAIFPSMHYEAVPIDVAPTPPTDSEEASRTSSPIGEGRGEGCAAGGQGLAANASGALDSAGLDARGSATAAAHSAVAVAVGLTDAEDAATGVDSSSRARTPSPTLQRSESPASSSHATAARPVSRVGSRHPLRPKPAHAPVFKRS